MIGHENVDLKKEKILTFSAHVQNVVFVFLCDSKVSRYDDFNKF